MIKRSLEERYQNYLMWARKRTAAGKKTYAKSFNNWNKSRILQLEIMRKKRLDPEYREVHRIKSKERWNRRKAHFREKQREWKRENHEKYLASRRKWYRDNPAKKRASYRRYYANSVPGLIAKLRRGEATIAQVAERVRRSFARLDGRADLHGSRRHKASVSDSKTDSGTGESEA